MKMTFSCWLYPAISFISFVFITIFSTDLCIAYADENRQLYIVYMGSLPEGNYSPVEHHKSILQEVVTSSNGHQVLHRSYGRSFNGFAAWLHDHERAKLNGIKEVLSVFPSKKCQLHTTRSWDFMGFAENITRNPTLESDIIIGVLDSGIWPESKSFSDSGLGPVPKKWKGTCQGNQSFTCNRKIIGARTYDSDTIRDDEGHGTHTSSTAAGNKVRGASFHNLANGTARGGAPSSRIAAYKVCGSCSDADILAGFDDAIADGVDIITISLGYRRPEKLAEDIYAIGSFHAMANGIVVVNSAGNAGPGEATIHQLAPWLISVGASSIDRMVIDKVVLKDGRTLIGRSLNLHSMGREPKYPLTYASKFDSVNCSDDLIRKCECIDKDLVRGKIVVCTSDAEYYLQEYGAAGMIFNTTIDYPKSYWLPALSLTSQDFVQIEAYANTAGARATILVSEDGKDPLAPVVVSFSSRGPNYYFPDIMKPDVVAPGVGILAAYPSDEEYALMSGTSMSCPHAAAAIAYIKSLHPDWSPAALKSALMTTAWPLNATLHIDKEFAYGSGHISPTKAADPGLIYDISKEDYIKLICGAYDEETCLKIAGKDCQCSKDKMAPKDLNYPSMTIKINASKPIHVNFTRTVTNVAHPNSTYKATITADPNLTITVVPDTLPFEDLNEKKSFEVHVTGELPIGTRILSSKLVWSHGTHIVTSPIIVYN